MPDALAGGLCARCLLTTALASDAGFPAVDAPALTTLAAGTMIGSFQIVRVLGRGGMATVYEASDGRLGRAVALKVLPPEFLHDTRFGERFEREARVVAALEHPNIVPIYASGIDDGIPWMSMRLLAGGTIGTLLEHGRPDVGRIVRLLRPVASALDYAHAHGVVHRDVKPSNVLLDGSDGVCVGDFGLAHVLEASSRMTQSGLVAGTPQYMAPEQALGKAADHRCDIYSLAIVAYEMFAGVTPFTGESPLAVLFKHVNEPLPEPPEDVVSRLVMRAIKKGAAKEPGERWPSATALVDALEEAIAPRQHWRAYGFIRSIDRARASQVRWMTTIAGIVLAAATAGWLIAREPLARTHGPISIPTVPEPTPSATAPMREPAPEALAPAAIPPGLLQAPATAKNHPPAVKQRVAAPNAESVAPSIQPPVALSPVKQPPAAPGTTTAGDLPAKATTDAIIPELATRVPARPVDIVTPPERIRSVSPEYPQVARAAQLEGDVLLEATVTVDGKVTNVAVVRSVHPLLDEAARKAVLQYEYKPARRNGVAEAAVVRLTVSFRMR